MPNQPIRTCKLRRILRYHTQGIGKKQISQLTHLARNTVKRYIRIYTTLSVTYEDVVLLQDQELQKLLIKPAKPVNDKRLLRLKELMPFFWDQLNSQGLTLLQIWQGYQNSNASAYGYSQFIVHYTRWCERNQLPSRYNKWHIADIPETDLTSLKQWRRSSDKRKWERAVALLEACQGTCIKMISHQVERTPEKVTDWIKDYRAHGLKAFEKQPRKQNEGILQSLQTKKENLIKLIHETPRLHGINRASWSLKTLSQAYRKSFGTNVSTSSISEYIHQEGYRFRKARETLTSPDPLFREKLRNIKFILSHLGEKEKFFSVDEYGPFAIRIKGGRSIQKNGETKTFPQLQKSKGFLICTTALELSTNQITHFYSAKKNTEEMIKLLEILLVQYKGQEKIYFSWDAASWHVSKKLTERIATVNQEEYRQKNGTPSVELAPLPSSAQFLNVIESVFSGLAKAIIHNSDYQSVQECKSAIDLYFDERNKYFIEHPKGAGNMIWEKNCKSRYLIRQRILKIPVSDLY